MNGNNSSGQLKFFHNISIEKQDKQQQPKPLTTHRHTCKLEVGGENNRRHSQTHTKTHSLLWSSWYLFCYCNLFFSLLVQFLRWICQNNYTHTHLHRRIILHSHTFTTESAEPYEGSCYYTEKPDVNNTWKGRKQNQQTKP